MNEEIKGSKTINAKSESAQIINQTFYILLVSYSDFFKEDFLNFLLSYFKARNFIFCFEGDTWADIIAKFRLNNAIISGRFNTKKHILWPVQFRLSQFLICYYGPYFEGVFN